MNKILVVDDELSIRESFSLILEGKYQVLTAASGEAALKQTADQRIDLTFLDIRMPGLDGLETLKKLKSIDPAVEIVMVTAVNDVQKASEAIKLGARDYLVKPFDVDAILKMTDNILFRKAVASSQKISGRLIGQSDKIARADQLIRQAAAQNTPALILGEAGTEKELAARLIHESSARADLPFRSYFLPAGISAAEVKARIFGISSGSTTVDLKRKAGILDELRGGTLFLDKIENLPPGSLAGQAVEARLIAGSSQPDLPEKAKEIYDAFAATVVPLPPLRERAADLPLLVNFFIEKFNREHGKEISGIAEGVEKVFLNYSWPGNTRELELILEIAVINAAGDKIETTDLPVDLLLQSAETLGVDAFALFEKQFIQKISEEAGKDKERLAQILGITPALVEEKI